MTNAKARASKLFAQVKQGNTIFFQTGAGWDILGPAHLIVPGATVTVTKADGSTTEVVVDTIQAERTVEGIATRSATFHKVPTTTPTQATSEQRPWYPVEDRQAAAVGTALGQPSGGKLGYCHYCGLELDRRGNCAECV